MPSSIIISGSRIFKLEGLMKYWVESSYNFEDKKKEYNKRDCYEDSWVLRKSDIQ